MKRKYYLTSHKVTIQTTFSLVNTVRKISFNSYTIKMLKQFEELLNKQIAKWWKPRGWKDIISCNFDIIFTISLKWKSHTTHSWMNDLLFWDSWFLESLEWKKWNNYIYIDAWLVHGLYWPEIWSKIEINSNEVEYHKIQLVLLKTNEQRCRYVLDNIVH